jgi:peptidoglycan/LPS O-acetylase OafA/YrhL
MGPEFAPFFAACGAVGFLLFACSRPGRGAGQLQRRLIRPFALALGRESYGIYLWHFICTYASFHVFDHAFGQANTATSLALFIVTITATLIVSYDFPHLAPTYSGGRIAVLAHVTRTRGHLFLASLANPPKTGWPAAARIRCISVADAMLPASTEN